MDNTTACAILRVIEYVVQCESKLQQYEIGFKLLILIELCFHSIMFIELLKRIFKKKRE